MYNSQLHRRIGAWIYLCDLNLMGSSQRLRARAPHQGVHSCAGLRDLLRDYGLEHGRIFEEAGLDAEALEDGLAWIPLAKLAKVLTVAARVTGDRFFGLKHGGRGRLTSNPIGYLWANAPDLKTGLRNFAHFHRVLSTNTLEFVESACGGPRRVVLPRYHVDCHQLTDFAMMRFVVRIRAVAGSHWRPVAVC